MFDHQLFLGLTLSDSDQQELSNLPASLRDVFIQGQPSPYLQKIENEGKIYLGKYLGSSIEFSTLSSLEAHVHSLLKKLMPHYSHAQHPLVVLALSLPTSPS